MTLTGIVFFYNYVYCLVLIEMALIASELHFWIKLSSVAINIYLFKFSNFKNSSHQSAYYEGQLSVVYFEVLNKAIFVENLHARFPFALIHLRALHGL